MSISAIIGLLALGVILLLLEIFLPGGICGSIGAVMLVIGVAAGYIHSVRLGMYLTVVLMITGPIALWAWVKYFPKSRVGKKFMLDKTASDWQGYDAGNRDLIGKQGTAHTCLHPSGTARIEGRRVDVVTQGEMLEKGDVIEVIHVEGNRVVVARSAPPAGRADETRA